MRNRSSGNRLEYREIDFFTFRHAPYGRNPIAIGGSRDDLRLAASSALRGGGQSPTEVREGSTSGVLAKITSLDPTDEDEKPGEKEANLGLKATKIAGASPAHLENTQQSTVWESESRPEDQALSVTEAATPVRKGREKYPHGYWDSDVHPRFICDGPQVKR